VVPNDIFSLTAKFSLARHVGMKCKTPMISQNSCLSRLRSASISIPGFPIVALFGARAFRAVRANISKEF